MAQTEVIKTERELNDEKRSDGCLQRKPSAFEGAIEESRLQMNELALELRQQALTEKAQTLAELSVMDETIRGASDR